MGIRRKQRLLWAHLLAASALATVGCQTESMFSGPGTVSDAALDTGSDQIVASNTKVALIGAWSPDADSSMQTGEFRWRQTSGPPVEIADPNSPITSFIAPDISGDPTLLSFELAVDVGGSTTAATHEVVVLAASVPTAGEGQSASPGFVSPLTLTPGYSGDDAPPTTQALTVETDGELTAMVGEEVTLAARLSSTQPLWEVLWRQIGGNPVELFEAQTLTPSFVAPLVPTTLLFRVTGYSGDVVRSADLTVHLAR